MLGTLAILNSDFTASVTTVLIHARMAGARNLYAFAAKRSLRATSTIGTIADWTRRDAPHSHSNLVRLACFRMFLEYPPVTLAEDCVAFAHGLHVSGSRDEAPRIPKLPVE